jgi:hypothetical protein
MGSWVQIGQWIGTVDTSRDHPVVAFSTGVRCNVARRRVISSVALAVNGLSPPTAVEGDACFT